MFSSFPTALSGATCRFHRGSYIRTIYKDHSQTDFVTDVTMWFAHLITTLRASARSAFHELKRVVDRRASPKLKPERHLDSSSRLSAGMFRAANDTEGRGPILAVALRWPVQACRAVRFSAGLRCPVRPGHGRMASASTKNVARELRQRLLLPEPNLRLSHLGLLSLWRAVPRTACRWVKPVPTEPGPHPPR
jgi:hypothetical protein